MCWYFFLFLHQNISCGYSLEAPWWGASNEYSQHTFLWRNKKKMFSWYPLHIRCGYSLEQLGIVMSTHKLCFHGEIRITLLQKKFLSKSYGMWTDSDYRIYRKFSDQQAWINRVNPDQMPQKAVSDQSPHCLPHVQQYLDASPYSQMESFKVRPSMGRH